jgi:antitoxin HicB
MISYRVKRDADDGKVLVTAPDLPELVTYCENREDTLSYAAGAFSEAIAARMANREPIPTPSKGKSSEPRVVLPLQVELKVRLYQNMDDLAVRKASFARKMDLHRQEIDRLLDLNHATNVAKIEKAFAVLGKTLDIKVSNAS